MKKEKSAFGAIWGAKMSSNVEKESFVFRSIDEAIKKLSSSQFNM